MHNGDFIHLIVPFLSSPIGAWHGNGRKAAWWSPILLALWDENAGQLIGVCKCMSGFRDEFYIVKFRFLSPPIAAADVPCMPGFE